MKKTLPFFLLLCLAVSCHSTKIVAEQPENNKLADQIVSKTVVSSHSGNGTSFADAVIMQEKKSETELIKEQEAWLNEKYPGYVIISNRLENKTGADGNTKLYNVNKIKTADEAQFEVFFDVSIFYDNQLK